MSFQVEITETAYRDLDQILSWLSERSPDVAARLSTQFDKALSRLESLKECLVAIGHSSDTEENFAMIPSTNRRSSSRRVATCRRSS